jgi:hypothetical protein
LLIRLARHDGLDEALHIPAALHEIDGEPVEQLGMRGALALQAEIIRRAHQTGTEEHLPHMIHEHAGRERVLLRRDPLREADAVLRESFWPGRDGRRHAARHHIAFFVPNASQEHMRVPRLLALGEHHDVQLACGGLHLLELRVRTIERGLRELIRLVILQKLRQQRSRSIWPFASFSSGAGPSSRTAGPG